ncbi:MAG: hypothetical protein ABIK65_08815 [Candidatus Eisenbacteria bacterium]
MKKLLPVLLALFVSVVAGRAQFGFEMDLDGTPGNGPDTLDANYGDFVTGRVWLFGTSPLFSVGTTFCTPGGALEYQVGMEEYLLPESWTTAEADTFGGCVLTQATDFTFVNPISLPAPFVDLVWRVAIDEGIGDIECDLVHSGYISINWMDGIFDFCHSAAVRIGGTGTERTGWGAIKTLFR